MEHTVRIVDFEAFKVEIGLEEDQLQELYIGYMEELLEEREKLNTQFVNGELIKLGKTVHNIKGISGSYRAEQVFEVAKELDARIKESKMDEMSIWIERLTNCISAVENEIKQYFDLKQGVTRDDK